MLFVGARLAGESTLKDAFAGKPGSYEKHWRGSLGFHMYRLSYQCNPKAFFAPGWRLQPKCAHSRERVSCSH